MKPNDLFKQLRQIEKLIQRDIPRIVKNEGLKHFTESWDKQGFTDQNLVKWKEREPPEKLTKKKKQTSKTYTKWAAKNEGRALLISNRNDTQGGHLKDSITARVSGGQLVIFATDKPYAEIHNSGGMAGRGLKAKIPKRQFMGESETLFRNIEKKIDKRIKEILNFQNL